jgi:hypothetical protein
MNLKQIISYAASCLLGITLFASPVTAQVFDSGPSDSALFDNVINVPTDPNIDSSFDMPASIGDDGLTTQLNVSTGGSVGNYANVLSGGEVNINGGTVGDVFDARTGSEVNLDGGAIGFGFTAYSGSRVTISGGTVGRGFREFGSNVELIGGEFQLNGAPFSGDSISVNNFGDTFTGTLADGSAFIFAWSVTDRLSGVQLTTAALPTLDLSPVVVSTSNPSLPSGLRSGQSLTLLDGGELGERFEVVSATLNIEGGNLGVGAGAIDSTVNISGGAVGDRFSAYSGSVVSINGGNLGDYASANPGSEINITSGGSVGHGFYALHDSEVNISGGSVGDQFNAFGGSTVNISGGSVGDFFEAKSDSVVNINGGIIGDGFSVLEISTVNINGGSVGDDFQVRPGTVNITGGTVGEAFKAHHNGRVNLFGSDFVLHGLNRVFPLDFLSYNSAFTISARDATLSGVLADGSAFSFDLNSIENPGEDFFDPGATLTVTLFSNALLGDCNQDGEVTSLDIAPFVAVLASRAYLEQADCNRDDDVNFLDIAPFINTLTFTPRR